MNLAPSNNDQLVHGCSMDDASFSKGKAMRSRAACDPYARLSLFPHPQSTSNHRQPCQTAARTVELTLLEHKQLSTRQVRR